MVFGCRVLGMSGLAGWPKGALMIRRGFRWLGLRNAQENRFSQLGVSGLEFRI